MGGVSAGKGSDPPGAGLGPSGGGLDCLQTARWNHQRHLQVERQA